MSRNLEKASIVSRASCMWALGMVAGLMKLEDSKHRVAIVILTRMMDPVFARSWSAGKHAVWNHHCRKVL